MIKIQSTNINLTPLNLNMNITDINEEYTLKHVHNVLYNIHKFVPCIPSTNIELTNNQEIIRAENFNFCTLKNDTCISDSLRNNVLFEKFLLALVSKIIDPNMNMLDIGSNIGVWSIVYSSFLKGQIYAFEPQEEIYNCLIKNISLNNCKNIIPYNIGLSDKKTEYLMNATYDTSQNFGAFRICPDGNLSINVDTGDSLNLSNIGFIKIDVEGHELEALQGLSNTINTYKPIILIEIHSSHENANNTFKYILNHGYKYVLKITHCDYLFIYNI
jgi:FkbM family methyltransferase